VTSSDSRKAKVKSMPIIYIYTLLNIFQFQGQVFVGIMETLWMSSKTGVLQWRDTGSLGRTGMEGEEGELHTV